MHTVLYSHTYTHTIYTHVLCYTLTTPDFARLLGCLFGVEREFESRHHLRAKVMSQFLPRL
jgi:hypothetical protein